MSPRAPSTQLRANLHGYVIGTDATIAQHIETVVKRKYVHEKMQGTIKYLVPSALGIGLVEGYDAIGFERSLSRPQLRRDVCPSVNCTVRYLTCA